ncbi:hypothetical protein ACJ41O_007569 [Fusarium nematophilum]
MASTQKSFKYDRIDTSKDAIRLIRLCRGYDTNPIRCELSEVLLDKVEGIPYAALSYTWGDPSITVEIFLNGCPIRVTSNLYHALYCLRRTDEDQYLWVDAVCIDQNDHGERNHQVGQMRRVYEEAEKVIIWLGRTTDGIDLLLDTVNLLDRRVRAKSRRRSDWCETAQSEWRSLVVEMGGEDAPLYQLRKRALQELLLRPWFRRIWVVQEATSARSARIACAWKSAPTRTFVLMPSLMGVVTGPRSQALLEAMPGPLRPKPTLKGASGLHTLLCKFSQSEATDPRDQIYALLGISSDASGSNSPLRANYQLNVAQTIRETVSFLAFGEVLDHFTSRMPEYHLFHVRQPLASIRSMLFEWALGENDMTLAKMFIRDPNLDINEQLPCDRTPLEHAAYEGASLQIIQALLDRSDLAISAFLQGSLCLSHAAGRGRMDVVRLLLSREGDNVTGGNRTGMTPLGHATKAGRLDIMDAILVHDTFELRGRYSDIKSPLVVAAEEGNIDALEFLLSRGFRNAAWDGAVHRAALAAAVGRGHIAAARILVRAGAQINVEAPGRLLPLHTAIDRGNVELVKLLLAMGADLNLRNTKTHDTALETARKTGGEVVIKMLVDRGAK